MSFVPAGEIIGEAHNIRVVHLSESSKLPDGEYAFIDLYCNDLTCDCRKTMIKVMLNRIHVATINFGWESPEFYKQWMGSDLDEIMPPMHGATIDLNSPDKVSPQGVLAFFKALLDQKWTDIIKKNYSAVRKQLAEPKGTNRGKRN